jgi:hypothetical protein
MHESRKNIGSMMMYLEAREKFLLPRYIRGQYKRADVPLELGLHSIRELFRDSALQEAANCRPPVVVLQNRGVLK